MSARIERSEPYLKTVYVQSSAEHVSPSQSPSAIRHHGLRRERSLHDGLVGAGIVDAVIWGKKGRLKSTLIRAESSNSSILTVETWVK